MVPELASRAHMEQIVPVTTQALQKAGVSLDELDAIAFTAAPGLIGSLLVGAQFAKSMALSLEIPLIAVHHMQAHVLSNLLADPPADFPFLCLTVSGGHTQIVICKSPLEMEVIGETIDDAAGEAFDKAAKLLGLPYPGGPMIDTLSREGNPNRFTFPEPRIPGYDFSFSGLKTAILYFLKEQLKKDHQFIEKNLNDLCASIQLRIVSILINKLKKAVNDTAIHNVCIAGGVSANSSLRKLILKNGSENNWKVTIPPFEYCTDNAAMIAITGYYKFLANEFSPFTVTPSARATWD